MALVACPTASIWTVSHLDSRAGVEAFPEPIVDRVYFCGFTAEASFGAWSYLVVRPEGHGGNVLVDSPRFSAPLARQIKRLGGIRLMILSHRDDSADHAKFATHFDRPRVMHEADGAARLGVEQVVTGEEPLALDRELLCVPTPGHTRGHQVFLYRNKVLFTGNHLAWSPRRETLVAFREVYWDSWADQTRSMEKLLAYEFEWALPGHGRIHFAPPDVLHEHLRRCVASMKGGSL
jgi:glyoxylase-like metal-dependent hydrolase (beta-lactamase superfamily II)